MMTLDNRNLSDGERIRLLHSLDRDDLDRATIAAQSDPNAVGGVPIEPRRYPLEPALDVPTQSFALLADPAPVNRPDLELIEDDFDSQCMREAAASYQFSESLRISLETQRKARGRYLAKTYVLYPILIVATSGTFLWLCAVISEHLP